MRQREQATDKREAILETALVLFTERGFYGTPTAMISREAGVATGTLFFYFKNKRGAYRCTVPPDQGRGRCRPQAGGRKGADNTGKNLQGGKECNRMGYPEPGKVPVHGAVCLFAVCLHDRPRRGHVALPLFAGACAGGYTRRGHTGLRPGTSLFGAGLVPLRAALPDHGYSRPEKEGDADPAGTCVSLERPCDTP